MDKEHLRKFQKLTSSEYRWSRILVDEKLANGEEIEKIIDQIAIDRVKLALAKLDFARTLPEEVEVSQKTKIGLCYYAMYQLSRAVVFHTYRWDIDDHERLSKEVGKILGRDYEKLMKSWRRIRNEVDYSPYPSLDSPLAEIYREAINTAERFYSLCTDYLSKRGVEI